MLWAGLLCWKEPALSSRLDAVPEKVLLEGEYWRLWTAMAIHADIPHFAFNALFLAFFSYMITALIWWAHPVRLSHGRVLAHDVRPRRAQAPHEKAVPAYSRRGVDHLPAQFGA